MATPPTMPVKRLIDILRLLPPHIQELSVGELTVTTPDGRKFFRIWQQGDEHRLEVKDNMFSRILAEFLQQQPDLQKLQERQGLLDVFTGKAGEGGIVVKAEEPKKENPS